MIFFMLVLPFRVRRFDAGGPPSLRASHGGLLCKP
jgi:hypothetical protein